MAYDHRTMNAATFLFSAYLLLAQAREDAV